MMEDLVIGIDLGTTNSCVSLYLDGKTRILENSDGGRITPSFIFFTSLNEAIVGEHAKSIADTKPDHGIYEVKRLVGRSFNDSYIQKNMVNLPFKLTTDEMNNSVVEIKQKNTILKKTPRELSSIILKKLKSDVEDKLGQAVDKAVITVPAYFNVTQREVTLGAAKDAGFTVLKLLNEPTAAALFYYFENDCFQTTYSLVYDLGGGTFDVALLKKNQNKINIISVNGDTQLGGHDFDNLILDYVCEHLKSNYNYDPRNDKENLKRLHSKCENAKKQLSCLQETIIILIGFVQTYSKIEITLTRKQFEDFAMELFQKTISIVDSCIKASGISKKSIKEVILSGGSTRIPRIQQMLAEYFGRKKLNKFVNPDECVAEGAALQAAMLSNCSKQSISKIHLTDVIPLSLGVAVLAHEMCFIIKRNSPIPAKGDAPFATIRSNQKGIMFEIYEGERTDVRKNRFLGKMTINDLTLAPPGQCKVFATMTVDENGILTLTAQESFKDNVKKLQIDYIRESQDKEEIQNSLIYAQKFKEDDQQFKKFASIKGYLIKYCEGVKYNLNKKNLLKLHKNINDTCEEALVNVENMELKEEKLVKELITNVALQCEPIVKYYKFELMPPIPSELI